MTTWNELREVVHRTTRTDPTWVSQRQSILQIIDRAEAAELDPVGVPTVSNLATIIAEGKRACRRRNYGDLQDLFRKAATLTNTELRLALCVSEVDTIPVVQAGDQYLLSLNQTQYERVRRSTRARHVYRLRSEAEAHRNLIPA